LSAAICSPVRATLTLWISDIFNPRAAAHSSSKNYYSFVNISRAILAAYRRHVDIGDSRCCQRWLCELQTQPFSKHLCRACHGTKGHGLVPGIEQTVEGSAACTHCSRHIRL
jgi:hypothetical protein